MGFISKIAGPAIGKVVEKVIEKKAKKNVTCLKISHFLQNQRKKEKGLKDQVKLEAKTQKEQVGKEVLVQPTKKEQFKNWKKTSFVERYDIDVAATIKRNARQFRKEDPAQTKNDDDLNMQIGEETLFDIEDKKNAAKMEEVAKLQREKEQEKKHQEWLESFNKKFDTPFFNQTQAQRDEERQKWMEDIDKIKEGFAKDPFFNRSLQMPKPTEEETRKIFQVEQISITEPLNELVTNYNIKTALMTAFVAASVFGLVFGMPAMAVFSLYLATIFQGGRDEDVTQTERLISSFKSREEMQKKFTGKQEQKIIEPTFHFWGATHLRFA